MATNSYLSLQTAIIAATKTSSPPRFRLANLEKHNFRAYAAQHGNNPAGYKARECICMYIYIYIYT